MLIFIGLNKTQKGQELHEEIVQEKKIVMFSDDVKYENAITLKYFKN
jgi:hypothetical protein